MSHYELNVLGKRESDEKRNVGRRERPSHFLEDGGVSLRPAVRRAVRTNRTGLNVLRDAMYKNQLGFLAALPCGRGQLTARVIVAGFFMPAVGVGKLTVSVGGAVAGMADEPAHAQQRQQHQSPDRKQDGRTPSWHHHMNLRRVSSGCQRMGATGP